MTRPAIHSGTPDQSTTRCHVAAAGLFPAVDREIGTDAVAVIAACYQCVLKCSHFPTHGNPMPAPLHVVILAAGEGKRMKSTLPKVLQRIAGRPMLAHVIESARALAPAGIHVVYGHGGEAVRVAFSDQTDLMWAEQAQQLGTGHAVQQAM